MGTAPNQENASRHISSVRYMSVQLRTACDVLCVTLQVRHLCCCVCSVRVCSCFENYYGDLCQHSE